MLGRIPLLAAQGAATAVIVGASALGAGPAPAALAASGAATQQARPSGPPIPSGAAAQLVRELRAAWQITRGSGVIVAVLDTGVANVNGLTGKVIAGPDYAPVANPVLIDGTVLASLIAGRGPSQSTAPASIGRAPDARILSERIVAYGSGAKSALQYQLGGIWEGIEAKAIRYAVNHGAKVIVCAESGTLATTDLANAVAYAISKNVVVVTSGFALTQSNTPLYPDSLPGVINVSGRVLPGVPGPRSARFPINYSVLVTAPANDLFATGPGNRIYIGFGLYSAMAWTAGTVALIKSAYPQLSPALVARALATSASYHPAGGYNARIGFGLINPIAALRAASRLRTLRLVAAAGPGVADPAARLSSGSAPGVIDAAPPSPAALAGSSAAVVVGLAALAFAFVMIRRGRRGHAALAAAVEPSPEPALAVADRTDTEPPVREPSPEPALAMADRTDTEPPAREPSPEPAPAIADRTDSEEPVRNENGPAAAGPDQPADGSEPPL